MPAQSASEHETPLKPADKGGESPRHPDEEKASSPIEMSNARQLSERRRSRQSIQSRELRESAEAGPSEVGPSEAEGAGSPAKPPPRAKKRRVRKAPASRNANKPPPFPSKTQSQSMQEGRVRQVDYLFESRRRREERETAGLQSPLVKQTINWTQHLNDQQLDNKEKY